jgi:hypothetical protein
VFSGAGWWGILLLKPLQPFMVPSHLITGVDSLFFGLSFDIICLMIKYHSCMLFTGFAAA